LTRTSVASREGGGRTLEVREAALTLFAERGYHGTSMRDIAEAIGLRAPALYNHVGSKQEILKEIVLGTMEQLFAEHEAAVAGVADVAEQLRRAVEAHVRYAVTHRREVLVNQRDVLSLEEKSRALLVDRRNEYEGLFRKIVERGVGEDRFGAASARMASYSILDMGNGVAGWFREDGPLSGEEVAAHYGEIALGAPPPGNAESERDVGVRY
jgi:AcrR family transcriptional regulator